MMEIVPPVHTRKSPVETCLVFVMTGAVFGKNTFPIRGHNRMKVGTEIRPDVLNHDRLLFALTENGNRLGTLILARFQHYLSLLARPR